MQKRMVSGWIVMAMVALWFPRVHGAADTLSECAARAYAEDVAAKQDWQRGLRELIVTAKPDLAPLATLDMEQQLALIDRRQAQFKYLLRTDARRIHTREGLPAFRNYEWTDADARVLREQNASYVAVERKIADLERQTRGHSDWPALRDYSRTVLAVSPGFQDLLKRLQARDSTIAGILKGCQP